MSRFLPSPRSTLFPLPLVAIVVLLLLLIFVTPNLLSLGKPSAGSLASAAELVLDKATASSPLWVYVTSLGMVRFASVSVAFDGDVTWPTPASDAGFHWGNRTNQTGVVFLAASTVFNPVALRIETVYVDPSGVSVVSVGIYEVNVTAATLRSGTLYPGEDPIPATPLDSLPVTVLLPSAPMGTNP